ncbi:MAG: C_GCAxxG_C_C family protein [Blautia sp.]|nr:C_GCAxxG_C_C family protein [Blautia sp.]
MDKYLEKAKALRAVTERHYSCSQSVLCAFAEDFGLDEEMAYHLMGNTGGGLRMGGTCGAIIGAVTVLGLAGIDDKKVILDLYRDIKAEHEGCMDCRDLLRISAEKGEEKKPHCDGLVLEMVERTEKLIRQYAPGKLPE